MMLMLIHSHNSRANVRQSTGQFTWPRIQVKVIQGDYHVQLGCQARRDIPSSGPFARTSKSWRLLPGYQVANCSCCCFSGFCSSPMHSRQLNLPRVPETRWPSAAAVASTCDLLNERCKRERTKTRNLARLLRGKFAISAPFSLMVS